MTIRKVAIVGKGALGLLFGSQLERELGALGMCFVMDGPRYERKAGSPVTVNGQRRTFRDVRPSEAGVQDLVIVAVKAGGLDGALDLMVPLVGPDTCIVSLLNGISSEDHIAERYGWERTLVCVAQGMDAVRDEHGLTYHHPGELVIGAGPGTDPGAVAAVDALLRRADISHTVSPDIQHALWRKYMLNVGVNQTCAVMGGTYGSVSAPGEQNRTFVAAMREVVAVAQAEGISLDESDLTFMVRLVASLAPDGMPSMAQDRLARRPSEVEEFSGALIPRAALHKILVPTCQWLYDEMHRIEAGY